MRKIISSLLALIFMFSSFITAAPVFAAGGVKCEIESFSADRYDVTETKRETVTFTAKIRSDKALPKKSAAVYDENNKFISYMYDDGTHGDTNANDGIYTAACSLDTEKVCTVDYHAQVGNVGSDSFPVKFHKEITDADFEKAYAIWDELERIENTLAERGCTPEEIADAAYAWLIENESASLAEVKRENEKAFSFTLSTGIENYFEHYANETVCSHAEEIKAAVRDLSYIGESAIGVWSPYYGYDSSFSYNYLNRAKAMQEVAGYDTVDSYYGAQASVESFKNFDKYGVVMIDSHGADYRGGGYICIPAPGSYDSADVSEGHIVISGGTVYLRGTFMEKYCDTLPNSIVYIGICYGMAADNLWRPLTRHGAAFCCGYTDSVSFSFDGTQMDEFCMQLVLDSETTGNQNTAGEAFDKAIELHGQKDPYGDARFIYEGNRDVVASGVKVPVESVVFDPAQITVYRNNTLSLSPLITPEDANRYSTEWVSSAPEIVSVDEKGTIHAYDNGETLITLTLTDHAGEKDVVFTAECRVTVDGDMPVSGIEITRRTINLYVGTTATIDAHVLPANASNQDITYQSTDESIVKADEKGVLTPVSVGRAYVLAESVEGGFSARAMVYVKDSDIKSALNKENGNLEFTSTGSAPAVYTDGDRLAVKTTNKTDLTNSVIKLSAGQLKRGDELVFDWMVSSEEDYDFFTFYVNGTYEESISGSTQWDTFTYVVTADKSYTFTWQYKKDYSTANGSDCGMLDEIDILRAGETHIVTFLDMDGETVIDTQEVAHGESATAPEAPHHKGYAFVCWDGDFTFVRADVTVRADYEELPVNIYIVTFLDMDGETILARVEVEEGTAAVAPEPPEHEGLVFAGWDKDFSAVEEDMTVTAVYEVKILIVTFLDMDGETIIAEVETEFGNAAEAPEAPEHEGYTFTGWDADFSEVKEDMTVTAQYEINKYTVTFVDYDGEVLGEFTVEHGSTSDVPEEEPARRGYLFIGWDKDFSAVTEDMTVTAVYALLGDANGDGVVNTADAVYVLKIASGILDPDESVLKVCDVNGSGMVNTADATAILKFAAGMIESF